MSACHQHGLAFKQREEISKEYDRWSAGISVYFHKIITASKKFIANKTLIMTQSNICIVRGRLKFIQVTLVKQTLYNTHAQTNYDHS
jgi:hypothetical protein